VLQGPLADLQRAAARLREHGIEAVIGSPEDDGCCSTKKLWLAVAPEHAQAAAEVFDRDWRAGLDAEQLAALDAAARIVIDPDAPETTCPACLTTFATSISRRFASGAKSMESTTPGPLYSRAMLPLT
jgi:hypothetical protein